MSELLSMTKLAAKFDMDLSALLGAIQRGAVPAPLMVDGLARWPAATITEWVAAGCPACTPPVGRAMNGIRLAWLDEDQAAFHASCERLSIKLDNASPEVLARCERILSEF